MIDDILKSQYNYEDDDEFDFDGLEGQGIALKKQQSYTVGLDGNRGTIVNEKEIRDIREKIFE